MKPTKEALRDALDSVLPLLDDVPEEYRVGAFPVLLRAFLTGLPRSEGTFEGGASKAAGGQNKTSDLKNLHEWEKQVISGLPEPHVVSQGTRSQQTVWAIVRLRQKNIAADRDSINAIIREELGVTPQDPDNTSRTLKALMPQYVRREKSGRGYEYRPSRHSLDIFTE